MERREEGERETKSVRYGVSCEFVRDFDRDEIIEIQRRFSLSFPLGGVGRRSDRG